MSTNVPNIIVIVPNPAASLQFFVSLPPMTIQVSVFVQVLP